MPPSRAWAAGLWSQEPCPCIHHPHLPLTHFGLGAQGLRRGKGVLAQPQPP